jgi:hypothetical protein
MNQSSLFKGKIRQIQSPGIQETEQKDYQPPPHQGKSPYVFPLRQNLLLFFCSSSFLASCIGGISGGPEFLIKSARSRVSEIEPTPRTSPTPGALACNLGLREEALEEEEMEPKGGTLPLPFAWLLLLLLRTVEAAEETEGLEEPAAARARAAAIVSSLSMNG